MFRRFSCQSIRVVSRVLVGRQIRFASTQIDNQYDIVIAGGGMVGLSLAVATAQSPYLRDKKILVLESEDKFGVANVSQRHSNRVSSISHESARFLNNIHVWNKLVRPACSCSGMQVWHDEPADNMVFFQDLKLSLKSEEADDKKCHMYVVENCHLVDALQRSVDESMSGNVRILFNSRLAEIDQGGPSLTDNSPLITIGVKSRDDCVQKCTTSLLVGADGLRSLVRRHILDRHNEAEISRKYGQFGLVGTLHVSDDCALDPDELFAWQKFARSGPIALLPLSTTHYSLVWTGADSMRQHLLDSSDGDFLLQLTDALRPHPDLTSFPFFGGVENRAAFPLGLMQSPRYCSERIVLVGDSAHRVHPLAGQGVNLGLADAAQLVKVLEENVLNGSQFVSLRYLQLYETAQMRKSWPTTVATDILNEVYRASDPLSSLVRSLGVRLVRNSPFIRQTMYRQAGSISCRAS